MSVLAKGSVVCDSFTVERLVRSDLSGECYEVRSPKGDLCHAHLLWLKLRERGLERWKHETAQVNRLELPCVPKTLGGGTSSSNRAVIVTALVTGESLEELRKAWGGRLPGQVAMRFLLEILDALETAHKKGIVHGALRLESVLVDPERDGERLCIADFAFARFMEESYRRRSVVDARGGATTSTLAPEQLAGNHLADARTDIYSAAAVAFRLLGGDLASVIGDGTQTPSAEARRKAVLDVVTADGLPEAVGEALFTALAPTRQERPASAWLLGERLREALGLAVAKTPSVSPADDEPRSITTLSELENVMLEEARRSMGLDSPEMRALAASLTAPEHETKPAAILPAAGSPARSANVATEASVDDPSNPSLSVLVSVPTEVAVPYTDAKKVAPRANPPALRKIAPKSPPAGIAAQAATASGSDAVDDSVVLAPGRSLSKVTVGASGELQWLKGTLRMKRGPGGDIAVANEPSPPPPKADQAPPVSSSGASESASSKPAVQAAPVSSAVPESDDTGRYVLDRPMASGGMATVYLGRMFGGAGFSRAVAIKRLHATLAADPRFTRMMIDEARMASRISHPNVVPVLDVVTSGESVMLVFEYVLGVTLSQLTRAKASRAALPPQIAAAVIVSALRGLEAAHTATDELGRPMGLVHRDVSPQNIMVASDGMVRVIDFGIARALGRAEVTTGTELRGKASYMAPERFRGQKSDHRVDLWSMGVLMWELCMGAKLFDADDPIEVALMVCTGTIPQTGYDPIDRVLERALSRDLATRYASAEEMAHAIETSMTVADQRTVAHHVRTSCDELLQLQREALVALEARFPDDPGRPIAPLGKIPTPPAMAPVELDYSGRPSRAAMAVATPRPIPPLPFPARPHLPAPASSAALPAAPPSSGPSAQARAPRDAEVRRGSPMPLPATSPKVARPAQALAPARLSAEEEAQLALASGPGSAIAHAGYPPRLVVAALLLATVFFVAAAAVWLTTGS